MILWNNAERIPVALAGILTKKKTLCNFVSAVIPWFKLCHITECNPDTIEVIRNISGWIFFL